jgi:hypothetical protein
MPRRTEGARHNRIAHGGPASAGVNGFTEADATLAGTDLVAKAYLYVALGVSVTRDPASRTVTASVRPDARCSEMRVGGPDNSNPDWRIRPLDLER